jgi:hypothetical protein
MIHEFTAEIIRSTEGSFTARLAPFGVPAAYGSGSVEFAAGSILVPPTQSVPLTVDHSGGVLSVIGLMTRHFETGDGLYAEFSIANTADGQDALELLRMGAVQDVSVGVELTEEFTGGVMHGTLDHVSLVTHGRFGKADKPSKVLSVHDKKEPNMAETEEAPAPVVATFDDTEIKAELKEFKAEIVRLTGEVDKLEADNKPDPEFTPLEVFGAMIGQRFGMNIANHALSDVIGDLGAADASGIVPDFYWGAGLQHLTDRRRPLFATAGAAPFPATGNNLVLPRITQTTSVGKRSAQKGAVNSQALQAVAETYPIQWFDGAVDVALELIAQSDPGVLGVIATDMLTQYAKAVELDATTILTTEATATGAPLDTATYAAFVADIITTSDMIEDAVGSPGNILGVTPAQWIAILSLMDGGDRRQFSIINPQTADGSGSLVTRGIDVGGVFVYRAPSATVALQYNQDSYKTAERSPINVQATNVELMGRDVGLLGATVNVFWQAGVYGYTA